MALEKVLGQNMQNALYTGTVTGTISARHTEFTQNYPPQLRLKAEMGGGVIMQESRESAMGLTLTFLKLSHQEPYW